jgi:hypothetical protein
VWKSQVDHATVTQKDAALKAIGQKARGDIDAV